MNREPEPGAPDRDGGAEDVPETTPPPRRWRLGLRWRRAATAIALLAGLGATGFAGGHAIAAVAGHAMAEHDQRGHHDDGELEGPLPGPLGPVAPPALDR